jgi:hypothetical protein
MFRLAKDPSNPGLSAAVSQLQTVASSAPAQLRADLAVIAAFDTATLKAARSGLPNVQQTPQLANSMQRVAQWDAAHCHA